MPDDDRTTRHPETVLIDGVRYVPVTDANPSVAALEDAIVGQWGGAGWRTSYPDAPGYLRVVVSDTIEDGDGETVTDFLARLVQAVVPSGWNRGGTPGPVAGPGRRAGGE